MRIGQVRDAAGNSHFATSRLFACDAIAVAVALAVGIVERSVCLKVGYALAAVSGSVPGARAANSVRIVAVKACAISIILGSSANLGPLPRCGLRLSRLVFGLADRSVASQIALSPTPFAYRILVTVSSVVNGIQPEAHWPTLYVASGENFFLSAVRGELGSIVFEPARIDHGSQLIRVLLPWGSGGRLLTHTFASM